MEAVGLGVLAEVAQEQGLVERVVEGARLQLHQARTQQEQVVQARQPLLVEVRVRLLPVVVVG